MRRDELIFNIRLSMRTMGQDLRKRLSSPEADKRRMAEDVLAAMITDKALSRYEIMIDALEGPPCPVISEGEGGQGITNFGDSGARALQA